MHSVSSMATNAKLPDVHTGAGLRWLASFIVVFLAGIGLFSGAIWARTVGVILALISAIAAFAWLPYYPIWGIIILTMAVAVMWALTAHGRDLQA